MRTRIFINEHANDPAPGKPSKSFERFMEYRDAATKGELGVLASDRKSDAKATSSGTLRMARSKSPGRTCPLSNQTTDEAGPYLQQSSHPSYPVPIQAAAP